MPGNLPPTASPATPCVRYRPGRAPIIGVLLAVAVLLAGCGGSRPTLAAGSGTPGPAASAADNADVGRTTTTAGTATTPVPAPAPPARDAGPVIATGGCTTAVTTIPGQVRCPGSTDPTFAPTTIRVPAGGCPSVPAARPAAGWLAPNDEAERPQGSGQTGSKPTPQLDALVARVPGLVPAGFTVSWSISTVDLACPALPPSLRVDLTDRSGARIAVLTRQLLTGFGWREAPYAGPLLRSQAAGGTEVVANDFNGLGQSRRVWVAAPDGRFAEVIAVGPNAPDQSGWPTTITRTTTAPPGQAPLSLDQARTLALAVLGG